MNKSNLVDKCF